MTRALSVSMLNKTTKLTHTKSAGSKKLGLRRETLVSLNNEALSKVAGGLRTQDGANEACQTSVNHPE
jgi:hypothetical protein